ncbi:MAG: hypothetical protein AAGF83_07735 [Cyanobacteria bacterium P01_G01_bin.67]
MNSQSISLSAFMVGILISTLLLKSEATVCVRNANSQDKTVKPLGQKHLAYAQYITHKFIGSRIITQFAPQDDRGQSINLDQLASSLGYDHFNWANYVELDPYGIVDRQGQQLNTPYNDPPQGGYRYDAADKLPFYWDVVRCDRCKSRHHFQHARNRSQFQLVFEDSPADYRLQPGEAVIFVTSLVGVKHYDSQQHQSEWEILHTFRWKLANPHPNMSKVSLIESDVACNNLSPMLLSRMQLDGASLRKGTKNLQDDEK